MTYKTKEDRRKHYEKNKDEINKKRREYNKKPEVKRKILKQDARWRTENREKANRSSNISKKKYEERAKEEVFNHYGIVCACCGESNQKFLTVDHINGGGRKHREKIKQRICIWLLKNNFPKGFQILCYNCNCGKRVNSGICPHKD